MLTALRSGTRAAGARIVLGMVLRLSFSLAYNSFVLGSFLFVSLHDIVLL